VILLDTDALIWLEQGHARARVLSGGRERLCVSPASLLELAALEEAGRIRLKRGTIASLADNPRWTLDDPPAWEWFAAAIGERWTRDPFDRLLVAHARLRRWRLATGDQRLLARLGDRESVRV
jgi:PIN domain nuclease of toxin-antitoxin system